MKQLSTKEGLEQRANSLQKMVESNDPDKIGTYITPQLKYGPSIEYVCSAYWPYFFNWDADLEREAT